MPKQPKAEKERKRRTVAKAAIAGKGKKVIARAAQCSTRHVDRLLAEPETQFLITEAMRPHRAKLEKLAAVAITAVSAALKAKKTDRVDHLQRMKAVERYQDLMQMAQGKAAEEADHQDGIITWEQFLILYQRRTEAPGVHA